MRSSMRTRTRVTLAVGFLIFVGGGAAAAYFGAKSDGDAKALSGAGKLDVLYAAQTVPATTSGSNALAQGLIQTKRVDVGNRGAQEALTDPAQLSGRVSASEIPQGSLITEAMFPEPQTRIGTIHLEDGERALAVQLSQVRGVAGFVGAGDKIDVYGVVDGNDGAPKGVALVMQNIKVLSVNGTGLVDSPGQPGGPGLVYLLAVTPPQAERLIYLTEFQKLYFDLTADNQPPIDTPGSFPDQSLQVL